MTATRPRLVTPLTEHLSIDVPLICGAMYPCSNPELIAAVSEAGAIGVVQPISLSYVHGRSLREGLRLIRRLTTRPIGFNAIVEKLSRVYEDRMRAWVDVAIEEGIRFFVTALGNPRWVVDRVHSVDGVVYHNVTSRRWADKALDADVDGLICVNARAGGHAGTLEPNMLFDELRSLGVPLVAAGGIGEEETFVELIRMGYAGAQLGTRFIATTECRVHADYKRAIVAARASDIVLTERISGVPVSVIGTPSVRRLGLKAGPLARRLLRHPRGKRYVRMMYTLLSLRRLKFASLRGQGYRDFFQAGRSVEGIDAVDPAGVVVERFARALEASGILDGPTSVDATIPSGERGS